VAGQSITLVANGVNFTGGYPLFDVIFAMSTPATIAACGPPDLAQVCTLTTDSSLD
jgi:hypothetical protein